MFESIFFWVGCVIIIFIISVSLLIFAPKSTNYHDTVVYPIVNYIHENNHQLIKNAFYKIKDEPNWIPYPDKNVVTGTCKIWPLYMFSIELKNRIQLCNQFYTLIANIPNVKTCAFVKIEANSSINKNKQWKDLSNNTLRCMIIIDTPNDSIEKCAIWVNGEAKKCKSNGLIIFDSSKEHSIYNKTIYPLYFLILDIQRPEKIAMGISDREYDDEIREFIYNLSQERLL